MNRFLFPLIIFVFLVGLSPSTSADPSPVYPFPGESSYFREWLICGPFPNAPDANPIDFKHDRRCAGFFKDFLTSIGGEKGVAPKEGDSFVELDTARKYTWQRVTSDKDLVSLQGLNPNDLVVAYAFCRIESASPCLAILSVGSNDGIRVFLNGEKVHDHHVSRWLGTDTDYLPVMLRKGENRLLLKVDEGTGDWGFSARLLDYKATLAQIHKNLEQFKRLSVVTLDDDIVVTFGQPYQLSALNPGALAHVEVRDSNNAIKALLSSPPGMEVKFPLFGFSDGPLFFRAYFPLPNGGVVSSEREYYKGKLPRHEHPQMLRRDLALEREGKPFLPIGVYGARPEDYALLKEVGFNFVTSSPEGLDEVQKAGLLAAVPFHGDTEAYLTELKEQVADYKNHPAILCWMLADEPEYNKLDLMMIHKAYQTVHELDPVHPSYLVITDPRGYETFGRCCDVLAVDTYPVSRGTIQDVGRNIAKAYRASDGDLPIWHCGQTFRWPSDRAPTPLEHRYMSYLAMFEGAKAFLWYAHRWGDYHLPTQDPVLWEAQKQFLAELQILEPYILSAGTGQQLLVEGGQGMVRAILKTAPDGRQMILAINSSNTETFEAKLYVEGLGSKHLTVLGENRDLTPNGDLLTDRFEPFGVQIYLLK